MVNTGSRDETPGKSGLAHFVEHALFKGTKKRKAYHIISRLEDVGGELNAYTTKEETCIHTSFLHDDYERAIELISDIVFHSNFPEKEITKEKEIILDEINGYKDNPPEQIFDDFEQLIFKNNPLAQNILGTPETVQSFTPPDLKTFIEEKYNTDEIVLSSVGRIPFKKLVKYVEKYFGDLPANQRTWQRARFSGYRQSHRKLSKNTWQSHCIIGNTAYDLNNEKRLGLHLLNNILGGPGMNSRLNLSLREKKGYSYNVESNYNPYSDSGNFCIYFGTDKKNLEKSIDTVYREFKKLREKELGILQLKKSKRQLLGQLAISSDNNENYMLNMAKSMLVYNRVDNLEEIAKKIESLTSGDILKVANEILDPDLLSSLIYK
jgi:predicted Zn-dependent peptidase